MFSFKCKFCFVISVMLLFTLIEPMNAQVENNIRELMARIYKTDSADSSKSYLPTINSLQKEYPNHPVLNYLLARLNALLGEDSTAIDYLKAATRLGYTTKLPFNKINHLNDKAFSRLREKKEFEDIYKLLQTHEEPIHKSNIAFAIDDTKLGAEGITYDPVDKVFYLGSMYKHKIVQVDFKGKSSDFTKEDQDGLGVVLGIHIDPIRRTLWACSESEEATAIFKYDLSTKRIIKKYLLPIGKASFNDLVIHPNGDVYISNSKSGEIYYISHDLDKLDLFIKHESIRSPNGITLSDDGKTIFCADYPIGIQVVDIESKSVSQLSHGSEFSPYGIDGLYFYKNTLYAVQIGLNQISKIYLTENQTHIRDYKILERNTPELIFPTTGVIADYHFYYITDDGGKNENSRGIIVMKTNLEQN